MEAGIWTIWDRNPTSNELKQTNMYKVGDKVKIRGDLQEGEAYGEISFLSEELRGKTVTINYRYKLVTLGQTQKLFRLL